MTQCKALLKALREAEVGPVRPFILYAENKYITIHIKRK